MGFRGRDMKVGGCIVLFGGGSSLAARPIHSLASSVLYSLTCFKWAIVIVIRNKRSCPDEARSTTYSRRDSRQRRQFRWCNLHIDDVLTINAVENIVNMTRQTNVSSKDS